MPESIDQKCPDHGSGQPNSGLRVLMDILRRYDVQADQTVLPAILAEWDPGFGNDYTEVERVLELPFRGYSAATYAIKHGLPLDKRREFIIAIRKECFDVSEIFRHSLRDYSHLPYDQRQAFLGDFQTWCKRFFESVEDMMCSGNVDNSESSKIILDFCSLLQRDTLMQELYTEHLKVMREKLNQRVADAAAPATDESAGTQSSSQAASGQAVHEIAKKVASLVLEDNIREYLAGHIARLCSMIEKYASHVEDCANNTELRIDSAKSMKLRKHIEEDLWKKKRATALRKGNQRGVERIDRQIMKKTWRWEMLRAKEEIPPVPGCERSWRSCSDWRFLKLAIPEPYCPFWETPGPVNPLLWFGIFCYSGTHRPKNDECLMRDCFLLATVHDRVFQEPTERYNRKLWMDG